MPFFHFGPPPHLFAMHLVGALAAAALVYAVARSRMAMMSPVTRDGETDNTNPQSRHRAWFSRCGRSNRASQDGEARNAAFEDYKRETLDRLEQESAEFLTYLARLKHAVDKAEFDRFMSERRQGPAA